MYGRHIARQSRLLKYEFIILTEKKLQFTKSNKFNTKMVEWNPLFKAPYNVQQSTINSGWKEVATALTLFDSRKRWRLDVACATHTGPSWVLKGRFNESRYTFCKPPFFSSLLSCAATSNNQDKGHLPLWTPFSHSGTSSWIVYRYPSHGSCCTKH